MLTCVACKNTNNLHQLTQCFTSNDRNIVNSVCVKCNSTCLALSFNTSWSTINCYLWCNYFLNQYSPCLLHNMQYVGTNCIIILSIFQAMQYFSIQICFTIAVPIVATWEDGHTWYHTIQDLMILLLNTTMQVTLL